MKKKFNLSSRTANAFAHLSHLNGHQLTLLERHIRTRQYSTAIVGQSDAREKPSTNEYAATGTRTKPQPQRCPFDALRLRCRDVDKFVCSSILIMISFHFICFSFKCCCNDTYFILFIYRSPTKFTPYFKYIHRQ